MDHLTPSLSALLDLFAPCFRPEVFALFRVMTAAWVVCLGRRTISRVWETTGRATTHDHSAAFRLFSQAAWNWDELCRAWLLFDGSKSQRIEGVTACGADKASS
jgi:hypothetical protein